MLGSPRGRVVATVARIPQRALRGLASPRGRTWLVLAAILLAQLALLLVHSVHEYSRFSLTDDFAVYSGAWLQIAHGHLNPIDTIHVPAFHFIDNHFELAIWPLALFYWVFHSSFFLLLLQDLALVSSEIIALIWVDEIVSRRFGRPEPPTAPTSSLATPLSAPGMTFLRVALPLLSAAILVTNFYLYEAAAFDFHLEVLGVVFVLAAGLAAYRGSWKWAWIWSCTALLFGDVVATYVMALGVIVLLTGPRRRHSAGLGRYHGLAIVAAGLLWMLVVSAVGANLGSGFSTNYAYLAHAHSGHAVTVVSILRGMLAHPTTALRMLGRRHTALLRYPASTGFLGLASPIGLAMTATVLIPSALNSFREFILPIAGFQNVVVVFFLGIGVADVLSWIATRAYWLLACAGARRDRLHSSHELNPPEASPPVDGSARRWLRPIATTGGVTAMALVVCLASGAMLFAGYSASKWLPRVSATWPEPAGSTAAALRSALAQTPPDAEVIASQGVIGRFSGRFHLYPILVPAQSYKVISRPVEFVLVPSQGLEAAPPSAILDAERYVAHSLHARLIASADGVKVFLWNPPASTRKVQLPA